MRRILTLVFLAALMMGCGVPISDQAETMQDVPFGLLDPEASEPADTAEPPEGPALQIYLVDPSGLRLVPVERRLGEGEASLSDVVEALLNGPTRAERRQGLTTAFADDDAVGSSDLVGGVASVDLNQQFTLLDGPTQRLAIAQMVVTLTGRPGVGRVAFTLEGQPIDIPRGDGTLAQGSVARDNYRELLPAGPAA
ncbi:MAG TPA: GerMN domain-containing protein [Actinomycetota bacterium]|nr:GerMN domain-containing protein [Actinomycetota bacterium]